MFCKRMLGKCIPLVHDLLQKPTVLVTNCADFRSTLFRFFCFGAGEWNKPNVKKFNLEYIYIYLTFFVKQIIGRLPSTFIYGYGPGE